MAETAKVKRELLLHAINLTEQKHSEVAGITMSWEPPSLTRFKKEMIERLKTIRELRHAIEAGAQIEIED